MEYFKRHWTKVNRLKRGGSDLHVRRLPMVGIGIALVLTIALASCKPDEGWEGSYRYPDYVAKIMRRNCSIKGCHTAESAEAAAGLNLENWYDLFKGARGGSPVIPYSPDQSFLLYSINTDSTSGPILTPTMPYNMDPLTAQQYADLRQWILEGARNDRGQERFPPQADRKKWYVANQGCDLVAVFDAESKQIMRYVTVGNRAAVLDEPHSVLVSPDQQSWYVVFSSFRPHIEKYSTLTDEKIADISLGHNGWNSMAMTPDGKYGFVVAEFVREVIAVDLTQNAPIGSVISLPGNVHGPAVHPDRSTVYIPRDDGNEVLLLDYGTDGSLGNLRSIDMVQSTQPVIAGDLSPYQVYFLPDGSKYYVICWHSHEVRVMDGATDSLLAVIPVGDAPSNMAYSAATGHLFVSCMEDLSLSGGDPAKRGSIAVIDVTSDQVVGSIYAGFQPYGLAADDALGYLVVTNRNLAQSGPASHHSSICAGRNGYVTLIDLQTLTLVEDYKAECTVDPISAAAKQ